MRMFVQSFALAALILSAAIARDAMLILADHPILRGTL